MTALDNSNNESQKNITVRPCINQNLNPNTSVGPSTSKNHLKSVHEGLRNVHEDPKSVHEGPNNAIQSPVRKGHVCKICGENFYNIEAYAHHYKSVHEGPKNVHEGPKIAAVVSITDQYFEQTKTIENFQDNSVNNSNEQIKQHNCSFCKEVFGNYPKESFTFNGCFLPNF